MISLIYLISKYNNGFTEVLLIRFRTAVPWYNAKARYIEKLISIDVDTGLKSNKRPSTREKKVIPKGAKIRLCSLVA